MEERNGWWHSGKYPRTSERRISQLPLQPIESNLLLAESGKNLQYEKEGQESFDVEKKSLSDGAFLPLKK